MNHHRTIGIAAGALALTGLVSFLTIFDSPNTMPKRQRTPISQAELLDDKVEYALQHEPSAGHREENRASAVNENKTTESNKDPWALTPEQREQLRKEMRQRELEEAQITFENLKHKLDLGEYQAREQLNTRMYLEGELDDIIEQDPEYKKIQQRLKELPSTKELATKLQKYVHALRGVRTMEDGGMMQLPELYELVAQDFPQFRDEVVKKMADRMSEYTSIYEDKIKKLYDVIPDTDQKNKEVILGLIVKGIECEEKRLTSWAQSKWYKHLRDDKALRERLPTYAVQIVLTQQERVAKYRKDENEEILKKCYDDAKRRILHGGEKQAWSDGLEISTGMIYYDDPKKFIDHFQEYTSQNKKDFEKKVRAIQSWQD